MRSSSSQRKRLLSDARCTLDSSVSSVSWRSFSISSMRAAISAWRAAAAYATPSSQPVNVCGPYLPGLLRPWRAFARCAWRSRGWRWLALRPSSCPSPIAGATKSEVHEIAQPVSTYERSLLGEFLSIRLVVGAHLSHFGGHRIVLPRHDMEHCSRLYLERRPCRAAGACGGSASRARAAACSSWQRELLRAGYTASEVSGSSGSICCAIGILRETARSWAGVITNQVLYNAHPGLTPRCSQIGTV